MIFPERAAVNAKVPKKSFYENLTVSTANKRIFIDQFNAIYWRYKLTAESLSVAESDEIDEIEVFEIELLKKDFDSADLTLQVFDSVADDFLYTKRYRFNRKQGASLRGYEYVELKE